MKYTRLALVGLFLAAVVARAEDEERRAPPVEIPDFSNLDEYIYEPKSTVILSFRHLSGPKAQFTGHGLIDFPTNYGSDSSVVVGRNYNDGGVGLDQRSTGRVDSSGNPLIDPQTGITITEPISPDGKTNSWTFSDDRQVDESHAPLGFVAFHAYSATITDAITRNTKGRSTNGLDLAVSHDMGKLFGGRVTWNLMAGLSVNDIAAKKLDKVAANLTTITDLYSLYGVTPPAAPYTSPGTLTSQSVTGSDGSTQTISSSNDILISDKPVSRTQTTTTANGEVTNHWNLKGAYYTFRGGGELWVPFTSRFRAGVSLGAAVVYSGSSYTVTQTYQPEIGDPITTQETTSVYKLLPGYYADASLQFDLTEKAGFFAGAVFQSAGSYTQRLITTASQYATKVDLSNQNGIRAGMTVRF